MAARGLAPTPSAAESSCDLETDMMKQMELREKHELLPLVIDDKHPKDYVTKFFTSQEYFDEIMPKILRAWIGLDPRRRSERERNKLQTRWSSLQERVLRDVDRLTSVYKDEDLALSALLHFSCSLADRVDLNRSPSLGSVIELDGVVLSVCQTIAKRKDTGQDVAKKLDETQSTIRKIRAYFERPMTILRPARLQFNPVLIKSLAFLIEERYTRTSYMVVKKSTEGCEIPEELVQMICTYVCEERLSRIGVMTEACEKAWEFRDLKPSIWQVLRMERPG
ncbi:hypothetical protein PRZ48_003341 [Zasmidium cellare]|uniref:Uncharacterized protein n=1 Tax=Zasmidium cellare TaxID=395010 RepID=A0ABR0EWC7_ZASCE|nr:hypothetical protein PRZ48_003341 [Zasmidium cellare]